MTNRVKMSMTARARKTTQAAIRGNPTPQANQLQSSRTPLMAMSRPAYMKRTAVQGRSGSRSQAYAR